MNQQQPTGEAEAEGGRWRGKIMGSLPGSMMTFFWIQCREQWALGPEGVSEKSKRWIPEGFHSIGQEKEGYLLQKLCAV